MNSLAQAPAPMETALTRGTRGPDQSDPVVSVQPTLPRTSHGHGLSSQEESVASPSGHSLYICSVSPSFLPLEDAASPGPGLQPCLPFTAGTSPVPFSATGTTTIHLLSMVSVPTSLTAPDPSSHGSPSRAAATLAALRSMVIHALLVRISVVCLPPPDSSQAWAWGHP